MTRWIPIAALALLLTGCGATGTGLGIAALTAGSGFLNTALTEDSTQAIEWRVRHQAIVAQATAAMMARVATIEDWEEALKAYQAAIEFSESNQPKILLQRMQERLTQQSVGVIE